MGREVRKNIPMGLETLKTQLWRLNWWKWEQKEARTPLAELENMEDNGKRIKREGEVQELGKLLAQHLGSTEAASQPRRAQ